MGKRVTKQSTTTTTKAESVRQIPGIETLRISQCPYVRATSACQDLLLMMDADPHCSTRPSSEEQRYSHTYESEAFLPHDSAQKPSGIQRLVTARNLLVANLMLFLVSITILIMVRHTCPSRSCSDGARINSRRSSWALPPSSG